MEHALRFYEAGRRERILRDRHSGGAAVHPREPPLRVPRRARPGEPGGGHGVSHRRPRAGVAPVLLPLEQHPRRRVAGGRDARAAEGSGGARAAGPADAGGSPRRARWSSNFAGQWLQLRNVRTVQPNSEVFPDFDDNLRQAFERETSMLVESIIRDDRNVVDLLSADYTFVNERLARHYGMPNVYGSRFRRVPVTDEARKGAARPRQHPGADVARRADVAGASRQVDPREPPRHAAAAPAARRPGAGGQDRAGANRSASGWSSTARIPCCASCHKVMDPARLRAGELRRGRRVAGARRRALRSMRRASSPTARTWTASSRSGRRFSAARSCSCPR